MLLKWFRNTLRALAGVIVFFLALVFDFAITVGVIGLLVMGCKFLWEWYAKFSGG
jgi:hypothetical protein